MFLYSGAASMKTYHASQSKDLNEIVKGSGDYAGIFTDNRIGFDYGDYLYRVSFDSICEKSDIREYLENNPEFLVAHPKFIVDCDEANEDDDAYFENQKLRALIAIELGFDAVEENDGWLVVNGKVEFIGHRNSEEVEAEIEDNY